VLGSAPKIIALKTSAVTNIAAEAEVAWSRKSWSDLHDSTNAPIKRKNKEKHLTDRAKWGCGKQIRGAYVLRPTELDIILVS